MPKENVALVAFNRGLLASSGLARVDLKRTALSAEEQTNWMPRTLGSMMLRPGLLYIGATNDNDTAVHLPFIFSTTDTAIIELTDGLMRVRIDEAIISRASVSAAVSNGTFGTDLTGWTDADETGATSVWASGGYMSLIGTRYNAAIRRQQVTVSGGDQNQEHALNIVVARGPVTLKVGSTSGGSEYVSETVLKTGTHSLAFTPAGNFHIELSNRTQAAALVDSVAVASSGDMTLATPWAESDLQNIRFDQSGDVVFVACKGYQQRRIERRGTRSWSVVLYQPDDGPFRIQNTGPTRLTPSGLTGDITITSSAPLFRSTHVGALFRITSVGQRVTASLNGSGQFSNEIRVIGTDATRNLRVYRGGTWSGTLTLQRSVGEPGAWVDVTSYTTNADITYNDDLDNQVIYYRIGFKTGGYTSGTADIELGSTTGGITGIARVTGYSSSTSVSAAVLVDMGSAEASEDWSEGEWSDYRGWPTAVALYEGRLWWAGKDKWQGSVSDAFESFDDETEGDSGPISRSIGSGPVDTINWLLALQRLIAGGQGAEHSARSSSLDEPLSPTNFNLKAPSTRGSSAVAAAKVDGSGLFVRGTRIFELSQQSDAFADYSSGDLTALCPKVGRSGFKRIAVQRSPDTRVHCVRKDGKVALLVYDPAEEVRCWILVETDGLIEDAFVLPSVDSEDDEEAEDKVYYLVRRTINGQTKRYLERWALESECVGGTLNKQADSAIVYTGSGVTTITGLGHLEGEQVVVWGNGKDLGTKTVASAQITGLSESVTSAIVGLAYTARFKSTKLAYAAALGTALTQRKRINYLGLILINTHAQGLRYGPDWDYLDDLPLVKDGAEVGLDDIHEDYDMEATEFNDTYTTDSRLCLEASAPRPATVCAAVIGMMTNDKA